MFTRWALGLRMLDNAIELNFNYAGTPKLRLYICPRFQPKFMKRTTLIILFLGALHLLNAQTNENAVQDLSSRIDLYLPSTDVANLFSEPRFIQIGLKGASNDVDEMMRYFERFLMNGSTMITSRELVTTINQISYYKIYLANLYDANDFQIMLEACGFKNFQSGNQKTDVSQFSNTIYSFLKSNAK